MSSLRQIHANRLNALKSTGPRTEEGKQRTRLNAVRHGLTAETVIGCLEDAEDYKAFEQSVCDGYAPTTAVERELVLRLASILWRLRRANLIETELFVMQGNEGETEAPNQRSQGRELHPLAGAFFQLLRHPSKPLDRLTRYEATLWAQARHILAHLHGIGRRKYVLRRMI